MANKKINELIEKAVVNANDLVFVGDPVTGWLYNTTIADLQVGSITGGLAGSGQTGYIPRFKTGQTLENSLLFNGASGIGIGTTSGSHYLSLNGDYARTIGLERSTIPNASGGLGLTLLAGGSASGMLNSSGGDLILKSGISTGNGLSSIRLFTSTSGVSGTQDNALIEQVTVLGNGNTGFGVINPTYKVEVDGSIGNGEYGIDTSFISFNNAPISVPTTPGTLRWNDTDGTLEFTMKGGNVTQQIGQELPILVKHADNTGLIEGKVVYSVGTDGGNLTVRYANSNMETTSSTTFGVMTESATGGAKAFCTTFGLVRNFDTSALAEGQAIWLDSVDGGMTTTKPVQPKHLVYIGVCLRSHATNGVIFVNVSNGQELEELHDVLITNRQNNQTLIYDSATSLWKNRTIIGTNGYIPYWDSTDLFKQSPILVSASGTTVTMNGMNLLLNDSGTLNYLTKFGSTKTVIDSLIYDSGTKIGIGTTNPEFLFTVVGGAMGVYSSSTNYGFIDTANTSMRLVSANGFQFTANNIGTVAVTRVDSSGNWGFGIGTPSYKIDVNGDVNINGTYRLNGSPLSTSNIAEGTNLYFTSNRVLGQVLTGLNTSLNGVVTAADSLIVGISKLQNQVSSIVSGVSSVFGRTGAVTAQSGDYTTTLVTEGTNLYYTQARFDSAFGTKSTTNLTEGTNLYFTNARARSALSAGTGINYNNTTGVISYNGTVYTDSSIRALFSAGSGISYNNTTGIITSTITQYTDAMARASLSFVAGSGAYNSTTGVITIPTNTNQLTNGANFITLASLSASSPLSYNSGTGAFSISQATTSTNGYLSSIDWNTFNNKQNALGYTPVPTTRTITINGTTQDLSADRTFTVAGTISGLTTNYIPKATSATTIGNSLIYDNGTNIGIGTTSPNLAGATTGLSVNSSNYSVFELNQNNTRAFYIYSNSGGSYIGNFGSAPMIFRTSDTERMRLDASGNLGLGVTPSGWDTLSAIQMSGGSLATYSNYSMFLVSNAFYQAASGWKYITSTSSAQYLLDGNVHKWYTAPSGTAGNAISFTQAMTLDANGRLSVPNSYISSSGWQSNGTTFTSASAIYNGIYGINPDAIGFATQATERMRITSGGNVGIGTTSPGYKLEVSGTVANLNNLIYSGGSLFLRNPANTFDWALYQDSSNNLKVDFNGTNRLLITSGGSATFSSSITTTSTINSGSGVNNVTLNAGNLDFYNAGASNKFIRVADDSSTINAIGFSKSGSTATAWFPSGNVGIGTTSPDSRLNINGGSTRGLRVDVNSGVTAISIGGVGSFSMDAPGVGGGRFIVNDTGNVGIGITSPSGAKLDVREDNVNSLRWGSSSIQYGFTSWDTNLAIIGGIGASTSIGFWTNGNTERMRITSGGSVGIATNNPTGIFQVAGTGNIFFGDTPSNTNYKFNVKGFSGNYISFWTPTLSGVNQNGIMSHSGAGLGAVTPLGYYASAHIFGGEVTGGGLVQVAGDVNISGTFRVNGTAIGTGGGGVSGSGGTGYIAKWSSATSLTNSLLSDDGASAVSINGSSIGNISQLRFQLSGVSIKSTIYWSNDFILVNHANYALTFGTNDTERMRISNNGRLLLGNTSNNNLIFEFSDGASTNKYTTLSGNLRAVGRITQDLTTVRGIGFGYDSTDNLGFIYGTTNGSNLSKLGFLVFNGSSWVNKLQINYLTINLSSMPTSSSGLSSGDVWRDGSGYLRIV